MSHEGKMRRGELYFTCPKKVMGNKSRQADLDYFQENSKPKETKKEKK